MMRSMFSSVGGLQSHQTRMDAIGNNIANVNTTGYKKARVSFQDQLSQTLQGATAPGEERGGTNPRQVGLGVTLAGTQSIHTQGNLQSTGVETDMAIEGNGFFLINDGDMRYYTRAGHFEVDGGGYLVNQEGLRVQGWEAERGVLPPALEGTESAIRLPVDEPMEPEATGRIEYWGNLDARGVSLEQVDDDDLGYTEEDVERISTTIDICDTRGAGHPVQVEFELAETTDENGSIRSTWNMRIADWVVEHDGNENNENYTLGAQIIFDGTGVLEEIEAGGFSTDDGEFDEGVAEAHDLTAEDHILTIEGFPLAGADDLGELRLDLSRITQYAAPSNIERSADGAPVGDLETFTVDTSGVMWGRYSNGLTRRVAQIALGTFNNPAGLIREGGNLFGASPNSGQVQIGAAGTGGRGTLAPGNVEMSNVDLAEEFTDMIVTQRGFQANSRTITTSDELLQDVVNLKR